LRSDAKGNAVTFFEKKGGNKMKICLSVSFFDFFFQTRSSMSVVDPKKTKRFPTKTSSRLFFQLFNLFCVPAAANKMNLTATNLKSTAGNLKSTARNQKATDRLTVSRQRRSDVTLSSSKSLAAFRLISDRTWVAVDGSKKVRFPQSGE